MLDICETYMGNKVSSTTVEQIEKNTNAFVKAIQSIL